MSDDERPDRPWWLNPPTLLMLALLGGTGIGGGGASLLGGATTQEIADLRTEIVLLRGAVEAANRSDAAERAPIRRDVEDHEGRLRMLEMGGR